MTRGTAWTRLCDPMRTRGRRSVRPDTPGPGWWVGLAPDQFYAEVKRRDEIRQREASRVVYPSITDRADVA